MNTMQQDTFTNDSNKDGLCGAIRSNNEQVLSELYQNNYFKVERYVMDNHGSIAEAKDIFQEAFIAVWQNVQLNKFSPESKTAFSAYLYKVSKYKWIDVLRKQKQKVMVPAADVTEQKDLNLHLHEPDDIYASLVRKHFVKLGKTCKEILIQFYFHSLSLHTIAASRQWTEATAKNNKYRCIQQLRAFVKTEKY